MTDDPLPSANSANSNASFARSQSTHRRVAPAASVKTVVTVPPWARDEPPSPTDSIHLAPPSPGGSHRTSEARRSDAISYQSSFGRAADSEHMRWWTFNRHHRPSAESSIPEAGPSRQSAKKSTPVLEHLGWKTSSHGHGSDEDDVFGRPPEPPASSHPKDWGLQLTMPTPTPAPFTLAQSQTPGWDSPWTARPVDRSLHGVYEQIDNTHREDEKGSSDKLGDLGRWARLKKRARAYLLHNTYVPLLFRFVNITFTTAALAIAIRIRQTESSNGISGALGSSPTLVVIFAPLTLVHVMVAIYLEYFGKPLGLWRTSGKLAHTLLEVLFICAWSAALSLCFDNFFTSLIPCADASATSWYSSLPRPESPIGPVGRGEHGVGDTLCDDQVALISLVGVGLLMYCFNLVISLYRIFEKVKIHHAPSLPTWSTPLTRK